MSLFNSSRGSPRSLRQHATMASGALLIGEAGAQAMGMARNIILARLLAPSEFGLAMTLALTISFVEMTTDLAVDRLLVQATDGDNKELQGATHVAQFIRGVVAAIILVAVAKPVTRLFQASDATWVYAALAGIPLMRALSHLDMRRFERSLRFGPQIRVKLASQSLSMIAAAPLAYWLRDFSVYLWVSLIQYTTQMAVSHMVATRPFRWSLNPVLLRRIFSFSWPLMVGGAMLFGSQQGDKALIGAAYTKAEFGWYSVAAMLAMMSARLASTIAAPVFFPMISAVQNDRVAFERRVRLSTETIAVLCGAPTAFLVFAGPAVIGILYGLDYIPAAEFVGVLGLAQVVRMIRVPVYMAAMGLGDTRNLMYGNLFRLSGLIGAGIVVALHGPMIMIAWCSLGGEVVSLLGSVVLARVRHAVPARMLLTPGAVVVALLFIGFELQSTILQGTSYYIQITAGCCASLVIIVVASTMRELRVELLISINALASRRRRSASAPP